MKYIEKNMFVAVGGAVLFVAIILLLNILYVPAPWAPGGEIQTSSPLIEVAGQVVSKEGPYIVIKQIDGSQKTLRTNSATTVVLPPPPATLDDVQMGDRISVFATGDNTAQSITIVPAPDSAPSAPTDSQGTN